MGFVHVSLHFTHEIKSTVHEGILPSWAANSSPISSNSISGSSMSSLHSSSPDTLPRAELPSETNQKETLHIKFVRLAKLRKF